jgi:hypothetical protein
MGFQDTRLALCSAPPNTSYRTSADIQAPKSNFSADASYGCGSDWVSQNKSLRAPLLLSVLDFRVLVFVRSSGSVGAAIRPTPRKKSWFLLQMWT